MAGGISGSLINRAALQNTPKEVLSWYIYFAGMIIATSGGLHGYNSSNMSGILKMHDFKESFNLASYSTTAYANLTGWVTSIIVLGGLVGSLISAPINDYFGRRSTLFGFTLIYTVGCIMQITTSSNINLVIGARALEGFAGGAATVTGTMYLAEIAPKAIRGLLGALFSTNIMLGVALGYWGNYGAILNISDNSHWQWRVPLLIQFIPAVTIIAFLPFIPESPRWYALKGKSDKALQSLVRLRRLPSDHDYLIAEYSDIIAVVEQERTMSISWIGLGKELVSDKSLRRRFIISMMAQLGFNFSGGNSITYYQNSILLSVGITGNNSYLFSGVYGLVKVLSVFFYALLCAERFGRRKMVLVGATINIVCVTWVAIYLGALTGNKAGGWVSVAVLCIFAVGYGIGWAPNGFGLPAETMPNRFRAKVISLCIGLQYLANFLLVRFFPNMVNGIGAKGPFIVFAVVSTAILIFFFLALPEVKGVGIEHMGELFEGHLLANGLRSHRANKAVREEEAANAATVNDSKPTSHSEYVESVKAGAPGQKEKV
ncbi:putative hexose transport-related protein [Leucosporidium creatinivorum]|uniref:Putative hexose transport-related protein n=1 Tax=Leucosporidium creatinivorum TaxID=106004 RepID=A0A1Y2FD13_9BASI|nr:putative hexose transport-related protein [Leucosporidium creatinivorum]